MTMQFTKLAELAAGDGAITPEEALKLRQAGWNDGKLSAEEAEALFAVNERIAAHSPEWQALFVEAIGEYVVNQLPPRGYVSDDNGAWLIARIDRDGKLESLCELEALVHVFEMAWNTPEGLRAYALRQIEDAVLTGEGPTRAGSLGGDGINATEAGLLRRLLFASGGERPAAIGAGEAAFLFALKDKVLGRANAPEWKALFVQGVANFIQGYQPARQLTRQRAGELEAAIADNEVDRVGFLARMLRSNPLQGLGYMVDELRKDAAAESRDRFAEAGVDAEVTSEESDWLKTKTGADGRIDEYEQALLDFLAEDDAA